MTKKYKVTIFFEGTYRDYLLEKDGLLNKDWNGEVADMFDSFIKSLEI
jgi:hypothetical protein